jgi:hypothetical protein
MVTAALGISVAAVDNTRPRMIGLFCAPGHGLSDALLACRLSAGLRSLVYPDRQHCDNGAKKCVDHL